MSFRISCLYIAKMNKVNPRPPKGVVVTPVILNFLAIEGYMWRVTAKGTLGRLPLVSDF